MDCLELTQIPVLQKAMANPVDNQLLERIFNCIYKLFQADFIKWILAGNRKSGLDQSEIGEMAMEAFQEGMYNFYKKSKEKGVEPKATLRTIIYAFGWWQFLAIRKKKKIDQRRMIGYDEGKDQAKQENLQTGSISEAMSRPDTHWDEALQILLSEEEFILYQAIRRLPKEKWREVIIYRYFDGLKPAEIAVKMKVSREDIDNKLSQARKALKDILIHQFNFRK